MKRANDDEREAKRCKNIVSIEELEGKIEGLRAQNRHEETISLCEKILSRNNKHTRAHFWISVGFDRIGNIEKAKFHLLNCVDCPEHVIQSSAFYNLGVYAENKKDRGQARIYYERALTLKDDFANNCSLGEILFYQKADVPTTLKYFKKALSL